MYRFECALALICFTLMCAACQNLPNSDVDYSRTGAEVIMAGEDKRMIDSFTQIDLMGELDPKRYGDCHWKFNKRIILDGEEISTSSELLEAIKINKRVRIETGLLMNGFGASEFLDGKTIVSIYERDASSYDKLSMEQKYKCALQGFQSDEYYHELGETAKNSLEISNAVSLYLEKQTLRLIKSQEILDTQKSNSPAGGFKEKFYTENFEKLRSPSAKYLESLNKIIDSSDWESRYLEFQRRKRNGIQNSIMLATDAACDRFKRSLNAEFSNANFNFGTAATIFGSLGAVLTDPGTVRGLAGAAGAASGIRAEYNDAFYRNKVVEVLTKAVDIAMEQKRQQIRRLQIQLVSEYSVEHAIDDAVLYNSKCSLVAALQETSESLQTVADPGLKWLANTFGGAASDGNLTQKLFNALGEAVGQVQDIQQKIEDPADPGDPVVAAE